MKFYFLFLLLVSALSNSFEVGVTSSRTPPIATIYQTKDGPKIRQTGMLYLLGQYIEKHTQEPTIYTVIDSTQEDSALANNKIMSVCYTSPNWVDVPKGKVVFTKPFMNNREFLVSKKTIPLINTTNDLYGLNIGLISGHHYPSIQAQIDEGLIHTEYYQSETNAFISLFRQDSIDATMFKEVSFNHLMQTMPQFVGKNNVTIHPLSFGELQVSCALPIDNQHYLPDLNNAIDEFISDQPL